MKKMILLIALTLTLVAISSVNAKYFTSLGGSGVEITRFFTHGNGAVTLYISGEVINLNGCAQTARVHLKGDQAGHKTMVATAMMAYTTGKKIGLHAAGCETTPFWGGALETHGTAIINNLWVFK